MSFRKLIQRFSNAAIPLLYALIAIIAGLSFPRIETTLWPGLASGVSVSTAIAIYSAIASGMIALTGIVFSLAFVIVQFSATAYSPRLVLWIVRDPVLSHALGVFTATFLYAIAALAGLDRGGQQRAPLLSAWIVVALLYASIVMFIGLIQHITALQISRMLVFTGDLGRHAIEKTYRPLDSARTQAIHNTPAASPVFILKHFGKPRSVQGYDSTSLVRIARTYNIVIKITAAVGDTVRDSSPMLQVFGASCNVDAPRLRRGIVLGSERTFEQDPKYAIRLLVDIAIRALSPAVNDPTTAVQALDQIEDLLLRLGNSRLECGEYEDDEGTLRLIVPNPSWDDYLTLALKEILFYGATSTQVTRRMMALLAGLKPDLPDDRKSSVEQWKERVRTTVAQFVAGDGERAEAAVEDRQGLGISCQDSAEIQQPMHSS